MAERHEDLAELVIVPLGKGRARALDQKRLRNYGTGAARCEQPGQRGDEVDEKNDQIAHRRIVAGRGTLRDHGRNNSSPAAG
jgi:hypothetical protein